MRRSGPRAAAAGCLIVVLLRPFGASAQEHVGIQSDLLFYGDNTEFSNPFREGETIFGAAIRVAATVDVNDRVTVSMGVFANQRFGSDRAFEQVRPVLSLTVRGSRSAFTFGTLPPPRPAAPMGPDRGGPHALLPPVQRETLAYDRPYEAGMAWTIERERLSHAFWINWQRLNTPEHRERFDGGTNTTVSLSQRVSVPLQLHVVHQGGQLYSSGPVADSLAAALGMNVKAPILGESTGSLEVLGLVSRDVPDRSQPQLSRDGAAFFGRGSLERLGWRGHIIFWRGRNFIKDEGDLNYLSVRRIGERYYRGTRDYAELGLTRRFTLAPSAVLDVSARLHRIEGRYEYSYRVLSVISAGWKIR
jgi:hypothetical protein